MNFLKDILKKYHPEQPITPSVKVVSTRIPKMSEGIASQEIPFETEEEKALRIIRANLEARVGTNPNMVVLDNQLKTASKPYSNE